MEFYRHQGCTLWVVINILHICIWCFYAIYTIWMLI